eukprot:6724244-Prymnesium_polylepis.1
MAVRARAALRAPRHLRRRRWREPHTESGGAAASAMVVSTVEHAPCRLIFPPARASGGPEIFV